MRQKDIKYYLGDDDSYDLPVFCSNKLVYVIDSNPTNSSEKALVSVVTEVQ